MHFSTRPTTCVLVQYQHSRCLPFMIYEILWMVLTTAMNMQVFWDVALCHWTRSSLTLDHEDESTVTLLNVRTHSLNNSGTSQRSWIISNACVRTSNLHIKLRTSWPPVLLLCRSCSVSLCLLLSEVDCFHALCNVTWLQTCNVFYASKKCLY